MKQLVHGGDIYRHPGVLDFSANLNPLGTPESVVQAAGAAAEQMASYPDVCCSELRAALAGYEGVKKEWIRCGNGAAELIFSLVQALRPKRALVCVPSFAEYRQALQAAGCRIEQFRLLEEEGFQLKEEILERICPKTDLFFLCSPNNPTGLLPEEGLLLKILKKCEETGTFLVLDECFLDFVEEKERWEMKPCLEQYRNLFLLKAFTKRYAMAGIRLGYGLCSNQEVLEQMEAVTQPWSVSSLAQAAGKAALREEDYVQRARALVGKERSRMQQRFRQLGLTVWDSRANYVFFRGPESLGENCLSKGVMLRDCSNYPGLAPGFYRAAVKLPEENDRLFSVMEEVLREGRR